MALFNRENNPSIWESSRTLGRAGERIAADYLVENGYRLVLRNFKTTIGRNSVGASVTGEIDIVALEREVLCFVEVKTRSSDDFAGPLAAVDLRKQRQIIRTARVYRRVFGLRDVNFRYDVVTVLLRDAEKPVISLARGYWTEAKFRKHSWSGDLWYEH
ncbi:MAG TPA: YraN family protein [Pyrinomonadaceae bacterium]|nr:YraN family protein [Pyrinomonadaceae bacterium]